MQCFEGNFVGVNAFAVLKANVHLILCALKASVHWILLYLKKKIMLLKNDKEEKGEI